jgi:tetratricopeptide (TPR) repeat protein
MTLLPKSGDAFAPPRCDAIRYISGNLKYSRTNINPSAAWLSICFSQMEVIMRTQKIDFVRTQCFTSLLITLLTTLTISDFQLIQNSQALAQTPTNQKAQADGLLDRGINWLNAGQVEEAMQSLQQALKIYREIKDRPGEGQALKSLGNLYYFLQDYAKAIESAQRSLAVARFIKDRELEARALINLGLAQRANGDPEAAIANYQQSLAIAKSLSNRELEWKALYNQGLAYRDRKDYAKAMESLQQSLTTVQQIKDPQVEAVILINLGLAYSGSGDNTKAIEVYQQSLAIGQKINNKTIVGGAAGGLGSVYEATSNYPKAAEFYQLWVKTSQELKDPGTEDVARAALERVERSLKDRSQSRTSPPPSSQPSR